MNRWKDIIKLWEPSVPKRKTLSRRGKRVPLILPLLQLTKEPLEEWVKTLPLGNWDIKYENEWRIWTLPNTHAVVEARLVVFIYPGYTYTMKEATCKYRAIVQHLTRTNLTVWVANDECNIYKGDHTWSIWKQMTNISITCLCSTKKWFLNNCNLCNGSRRLQTISKIIIAELSTNDDHEGCIYPSEWSSAYSKRVKLQPFIVTTTRKIKHESYIGWYSNRTELLKELIGNQVTLGQWRYRRSGWYVRLYSTRGEPRLCRIHNEVEILRVHSGIISIECVDNYTPCCKKLLEYGNQTNVLSKITSYPNVARVRGAKGALVEWCSKYSLPETPNNCCDYTSIVDVNHFTRSNNTNWITQGCEHLSLRGESECGVFNNDAIFWETWNHSDNTRPLFVLEWWNEDRDDDTVVRIIEKILNERGIPGHRSTHSFLKYKRWILQGRLSLHECKRLTLVIVLSVTKIVKDVEFRDIYSIGRKTKPYLSLHPASMRPKDIVEIGLSCNNVYMTKSMKYTWKLENQRWPTDTPVFKPQWGCNPYRLCLFHEPSTMEHYHYYRVQWRHSDPLLLISKRRPLFKSGYVLNKKVKICT